MTTFLIKKYEDEETTKDDNTSNKENLNEVTVTVSGSVSEIVAKALNDVFSKKAEITELDSKDADSIAISTEDINKDPVTTFNLIQNNSILYIQNNGFKTTKEEWFLTNLPNKNVEVVYTLESFIKKIKERLS